MLRVGFVASMATKLSDTLSSEIGKAYGKTTYLITTFQRVPKGTEGAVSFEGTLAGVVGSILIGSLSGVLKVLPDQGKSVGICIVSSFVATNIESIIGAKFQDKIDWLTNEVVNLIMTLIGAGMAMLMYTWKYL